MILITIIIILLIFLITFLYNRIWIAFLYLLLKSILSIFIYKYKYKQHLNDKKDNEEYAFKTLNKMAKSFCKISGIVVKTTNLHYLNKDYDDNVLIIANHTSILDPFIFQYLITKKYRPVAKIELSNLVSVHYLFKLMGMYFMDRKNIRESVKLINNIQENFENNIPVLIYPEGTTSDKLGYRDFKSGSLKPICEKGGMLLIHINYDFWKTYEERKAFTFKTEVEVEFLKPIKIEPKSNSVEVTKMVEEIVLDKLNKRYGEIEKLPEYTI